MINWFIWKWYVVIRAISLFQEDVSSQSHLDSYAFYLIIYLKSASNLNGNLNCSKELEHYAS